MIKAVCDKCGKEIALKFSDKGMDLPGWDTSYTEAVTI